MSTPEIDPVTAASEEEDTDVGGEHAEPTFQDQNPRPGDSDEEGADSGGMPTA